jgi:hypothetical protein
MSSPGVWAHYICAKMLPAISYVLIRVGLFLLKIKLRKQWNSENLTDCDIGDCQWQHIENEERTPNTPTVQERRPLRNTTMDNQGYIQIEENLLD